jgi:pyrroloquinoline quinone (PQQ) biosynthesis protein C
MNAVITPPIEDHPLFCRLQGGALSPDQIRRLALQIHHVVDHFPRFLAALLANMPDYRLRMPLVDNLFEEHGRMNVRAVHVETYRDFLRATGLSAAEIEASRPAIPVVAYTRAVSDLCLHHPFPEGLGALGVIEEIVARASPIVARFALVNLGAGQGSLAHFADHAALDIGHANEIYEVAHSLPGAEAREQVRRGMELGHYYHRRLYTDLEADLYPGSAPASRTTKPLRA